MTDNLYILLWGAETTIAVAIAGNMLGLVGGLLVCLMRLSAVPSVRVVGSIYVSFFRGVPLLVLLMVVYYFLPAVGLDVPSFVAAVLGLGICSAAYQAENMRGGFLIIPHGQLEAARTFGFSPWQTSLYILIPQALRASAPAVINEISLIIKVSSLVSVVGVTDLTRASQNIVARDLQPLKWYLAAGAIYLLINMLLSKLGRLAEQRLSYGHVKGTV
jgi:polar amino acid transport system permease protein